MRSRLDYVDVVYDSSYKPLFHEKLESIQYNSSLAITGATQGSSSQKLY